MIPAPILQRLDDLARSPAPACSVRTADLRALLAAWHEARRAACLVELAAAAKIDPPRSLVAAAPRLDL